MPACRPGSPCAGRRSRQRPSQSTPRWGRGLGGRGQGGGGEEDGGGVSVGHCLASQVLLHLWQAGRAQLRHPCVSGVVMHGLCQSDFIAPSTPSSLTLEVGAVVGGDQVGHHHRAQADEGDHIGCQPGGKAGHRICAFSSVWGLLRCENRCSTRWSRHAATAAGSLPLAVVLQRCGRNAFRSCKQPHPLMHSQFQRG